MHAEGEEVIHLVPAEDEDAPESSQAP